MSVEGRTLDIPRIAKHEQGGGVGGFIYVVEFSDGTVKPGQSTAVATRLQTHAYDGKKFGLEIARWWVSPRHPSFKMSERSLLALVASSSTPRASEYFPDADFDTVVTQAQRIVVRGVSEFGNTQVPIQDGLKLQIEHLGFRTLVHLDRIGTFWWRVSDRHEKAEKLRHLGDAGLGALETAGDSLDGLGWWGAGKELVYLYCPTAHWRQFADAFAAAECGDFSLADRYIAEHA